MLSRSIVVLAVLAGVVVSTTGCSALTRPDEITIAAEPLAAPAPPPMPAAPAPQPAMPMPAGAPGTG